MDKENQKSTREREKYNQPFHRPSASHVPIDKNTKPNWFAAREGMKERKEQRTKGESRRRIGWNSVFMISPFSSCFIMFPFLPFLSTSLPYLPILPI
ncbi:hypothetical protein BDV30DRAFT_213961 [Aspergillus minisclerotigenes]|uniref:Uncharacterized protein n=1 Tax=Aspergillus minisclerotigenes TaxID=656917 RepID=A0A5N6IXY9_9EURO|nr:hypothetical protein BDV30DRAFT_213961 [Aspergillus minisclerotigenes]